MPYLILLSFVSCAAGFMGGLTGTGGIIIAPVMIEFFGAPPHDAMATVQASFISSSMLALIMLVRKRQIDWLAGVSITLAGGVSTFASAAYLKPLLGGRVLTIFLAACIAVSGLAMLRKTVKRASVWPAGRFRRVVFMLLLGAAVGTLTGITGSGSNAILVPVMVFSGMEILPVLGSCQLFAFVTSTAGTVGNVMNIDINWVEVGWLIVGQVVGIWLGVRAAQRMDTEKLKRCVGMVCLWAGLFIIAKTMYALG